jgi:hypothetical protein
VRKLILPPKSRQPSAVINLLVLRAGYGQSGAQMQIL